MNFDFSLFLVLATLFTGALWGGYALLVRFGALSAPEIDENGEALEPWPVDYARSFFPIILIVLVLRSFLVEPFRIPSGSMMPTLLVGDFILVNKFTYGLRLPVLHTKISAGNPPQRGDIVVFRYPPDPTVDYIKRIIGIPGDRIAYHHKQLWVNGKLVELTAMGKYVGTGQGRSMTGAARYLEELEEVPHDILIREGAPSEEIEFTVPEGRYYVMGDNRDNSKDSRYWGMVPEGNLVGKAFLIWMNFDWYSDGVVAFERLGTVLH